MNRRTITNETLFIEEYSTKHGTDIFSSIPLDIKYLKESLEYTKECHFSTIAIFLIFPKN